MGAFYFDVGGVLITDNLAPANALEVFKKLSKRYGLNPETAYATYVKLQPSLDLGKTSWPTLCQALSVRQEEFERDWLSLHPVHFEVLGVIERLLKDGHEVGLATNMCRRLLDLLTDETPTLARLTICCSSDIGCVKPSPAFFAHASEIIGARQVVFVDDRIENIAAARNFGWTTIHATDGWLPAFCARYVNGGSH